MYSSMQMEGGKRKYVPDYRSLVKLALRLAWTEGILERQ